MEELLAKLAEASPSIAVFVIFGIWVMKTVVQPLTQRHLQFMDSFEIRDRERSECLQTISADISELRKTQSEHLEICRSGTHPKVHPRPA
jgi:hypothetical protein